MELYFLEQDDQRAGTLIEMFDPERCSSFEDLASKVDLVDLCVPTDAHLNLGLAAIAAGRGVIVEKPIARTIEEGARFVKAANDAKVPLSVGQVVRFFPEFAEGNKLVKSGAIGKPAAARTRRGGAAPMGGVGNWFMDHTRSGGVLVDLAIHDFDWLRWTLGEVKFLTSRSVGAKTMQGPDYALTTLTFDSGAVAHVEATWMDPSGFRTTFEVCGSDGMIQYDNRAASSLLTHAGGKTLRDSPMEAYDDPYYKELRGFVDAATSGGELPVTGYDGLMALSISLAAIESAKTERKVTPTREFD